MTAAASPLVLIGLPGLALAVTVLFSRPTPRRLVGALIAGGVLAGLNLLVDVAAHDAGWWWYPSVSTSYGPPLFYVATGLWYGAGVALVGWRLVRRFGGRGLLALLLFVAIYGPVRDYLAALASGAIVFGAGITPALADATSWASLTAAAQGVMRLVAGPAEADSLARPLLAGRRAS